MAEGMVKKVAVMAEADITKGSSTNKVPSLLVKLPLCHVLFAHTSEQVINERGLNQILAKSFSMHG